MAIVGFEFTKINVEKSETVKGKINIKNSVGIVDIVKNDLKVGNAKQSGVKFLFEYKSSYEPDFASITLGGKILYIADEASIKEILKGWDSEKKIKKDIAEKIMNSILSNCNIQSIILSNTVKLPPPVPMPKVNVEAAPEVKGDEKEEKKEKK